MSLAILKGVGPTLTWRLMIDGDNADGGMPA
jgi:hypothetical protein